MIQEVLENLAKGKNLNALQMEVVMKEIMGGKAQTEDVVNFLTMLSEKRETPEELTAAVKVMREYATKIKADHEVVLDTCGTGGDNKQTFNISTAVAFVVSGAGVAVAKHGNRSISSKSGSADILEALGINISLAVQKVQKCLDEVGISFLFAQNFHPAMKYAMPARKQIGRRTMFNILGPLSNPAGATHQLVGVYDKCWVKVLAEVLANLGTRHALVVHGEDGLDEITTCGKSFICEEKDGKLSCYEVYPEDFGFKRANLKDLTGKGALYNAKLMLDIFKGRKGACRDIVIFNAAAAIYAADRVSSIKEGIAVAEDSIDSGKAEEKLNLLKEYSLAN